MPAEAPRNITEWALTRHVLNGAIDRVALRWRPRSGPTAAYTYGDLDRAASRFASGLAREEIGPGQRIAILAGRIPELIVAVLGALRAGCVPTVLFSSFGPDPVKRRLLQGDVALLVTTPRLYRDKVAPIRESLPALRIALVVDGPGRLAATAAQGWLPPGTADFGAWLARGDADFPDTEVGPDAPAMLHFTSGTTGEPKGVQHVHEAIVAQAHTARRVLGLDAGLDYWCTADPGWVTGISYGVLAPLARGCTLFLDEEEFDARRWWENLATQGIEVLYTSPTALRLLRATSAGIERPLPSLRAVFSVGEPLAETEAVWAASALGVEVRDTWWQTETGAIVIATPFDEPPLPGIVGHAVEGFEIACLSIAEPGAEAQRVPPGEVGELAVRAGWPSMFRAYLDRPERYAEAFVDGWYLTGDLASIDAEGRVRFVGRRGDVFKSAGHMVSPAEVEEALLAHQAVADAGVWGRRDAIAGTIVEGYVVLVGGAPESDEIRQDILAFARERLGPALAPRALHFRAALPRTPSGKIVRRELEG